MTDQRQASNRKARQKAVAPLRKLRALMYLVIGVTVIQYLSTGKITWHKDLLSQLGGGTPTAQTSDNGTTVHPDTTAPIQADLAGRVVRVADGDTVSILDANNKQHKIRLFGIDTPERDQAHGKKSRKALANLVANRHIDVVVEQIDDYGRTVGTIYHHQKNINLEMVATGNAWWYRYYAPNNRPLKAAEQRARAQKLGLWALPDPTPPWDWRREQRQR